MTIKLGVIGMSEGNGHPYSWSAIFNGYDKCVMEDCGFPVIPRYLEKQNWPQDQIPEAEVSVVWTQSKELSEHIAKAANISNVANSIESLVGQVDAVLLARDDAENHICMAEPALKAGLPVYIDKPICHGLKEFERLYELQRYPGQIFSCSALKYAKEFHLEEEERRKLGKLIKVDAKVPKDWDKYAVHVIEPLLGLIGDQGRIIGHQRMHHGEVCSNDFVWATGLQANVSTMGTTKCPLSLRLYGTNDWVELTFEDTFYAFKTALQEFVLGIQNQEERTSKGFLKKVVEMIEMGRKE